MEEPTTATLLEFVHYYSQHGRRWRLKADVPIPLAYSAKEFASRLIQAHNIACYNEEDLQNALNVFVKKKTAEYYNDLDKRKLEKSKDLKGKVGQLATAWALNYQQEHRIYAAAPSDQESTSFSDIYHALIHSPALETLLQLEHSYSMAVGDLIEQRGMSLSKLHEKQEDEMQKLVNSVGTESTDQDVNNLSARQLEESQMQEIYWSSALSDLQELQKREYCDWVTTVHENTIAADSEKNIDTFSAYTRARSPSHSQSIHSSDFSSVDHHNSIRMEESFTIHLGHQMKTMHNIRLLCGDVLSLCKYQTLIIGGNIVPQPHRLQTAMSLYSENLSGMILLADNRLHSSAQNSISKEFRRIATLSTDFHFPDYDKQLCMIEESLLARPTRSRTIRSSSQLDRRIPPGAKTTNLLQAGDFYVTKHSNLAEVHAVFHLVTDETVATANINSRHPIMIGLRNVMHAAARHNVSTLTIPLLLVHEMTENLTVQWCTRRAELVLKCVKGFMMESISWDGDESRTVNFVVPEGISEDLFATFSSMLPNIFRVSNPLDLSALSKK